MSLVCDAPVDTRWPCTARSCAPVDTSPTARKSRRPRAWNAAIAAWSPSLSGAAAAAAPGAGDCGRGTVRGAAAPFARGAAPLASAAKPFVCGAAKPFVCGAAAAGGCGAAPLVCGAAAPFAVAGGCGAESLAFGAAPLACGAAPVAALAAGEGVDGCWPAWWRSKWETVRWPRCEKSPLHGAAAAGGCSGFLKGHDWQQRLNVTTAAPAQFGKRRILANHPELLTI